MNHQQLEDLRLKCENVLSHFKRDCENFVKFRIFLNVYSRLKTSWEVVAQIPLP
jgi:hypothetical protein